MNSNKINILVVDDVDEVKEAMTIILEDSDYNVLSASNGEEALKVVNNHPVDLIITDILMPEMDGYELAIEIQKSYPLIKLILISGGGRTLGTGSRIDYLSIGKQITGASHVLKKPIKPDVLLKTIEDVLND